jgi:hypothetical protein
MLELELCCRIVLEEISSEELEVRTNELRDLVFSLDEDTRAVAWPDQLKLVLNEPNTLSGLVDTEILDWLPEAR